jgi:hypothetical protein
MIDFDQFNQTELVKFAEYYELYGASRAVPREVLVDAIKNYKDIVEHNPLLVRKDTMSSWLKDYWQDAMDLQKPPFRPCPKCQNCTDMQIVSCYETNKDQIDLWKMQRQRV